MLITIDLDNWVFLKIIWMDIILFIFLYLKNIGKTAIMTSILGHHNVQTPFVSSQQHSRPQELKEPLIRYSRLIWPQMPFPYM
jgi:hypothetical protein